MTIIKPGSYIVGFSTRDGRAAALSPSVRIALAISEDTPCLTELGVTALNSALTQGGYQAVLVVSKNPERWPAPSPTIRPVAPQSFHDLAYKMKNSQARSSHPQVLLILDMPEQSWEIEPADIMELADKQPAVGMLVLGTPDYAASLIKKLGKTYLTSGTASVSCLFPLYGPGSQHLADVEGIPPLSDMCFAYRKTSRWERFMTNTPRHPARIRQTQFALPG